MLRPIQSIYEGFDAPELLVGLGDPDDAAVWQIDDDRALVITTDFFTPVVDDPYSYGAIAAANSLSDVYAMGATPFLALNIVGVPGPLPVEVVSEILRGGAEKAKEAGVVVAGGHTIQDDEPKYGLVVLGMVDPAKTITKSGARVGDVLFLTKPLGFGVTTTALKRGIAAAYEIAEATRWMEQLNNKSSALAREFGVRGGTDITGYSLLGHAWEMAKASKVGLRFQFPDVPFISCARKFAEQWIFPGGSSDNKLFFGEFVDFEEGILDLEEMLLFDAQTSGGLLLAVPGEKADAFLARAQEMDQPVWRVGDVVAGDRITVLR